MKRKSNIPGLIRLKQDAYEYISFLKQVEDLPKMYFKLIYDRGYKYLIIIETPEEEEAFATLEDKLTKKCKDGSVPSACLTLVELKNWKIDF